MNFSKLAPWAGVILALIGQLAGGMSEFASQREKNQQQERHLEFTDHRLELLEQRFDKRLEQLEDRLYRSRR